MTQLIIKGLLGVACGLALGFAQRKILERVLPTHGKFRSPWLLVVKFLLWAAAIGLGALVDLRFMLAMVGTAIVVYLVSAAIWYHKSRREG